MELDKTRIRCAGMPEFCDYSANGYCALADVCEHQQPLLRQAQTNAQHPQVGFEASPKPCARCNNAPKHPMGSSKCATCRWYWTNDNFEERKGQ